MRRNDITLIILAVLLLLCGAVQAQEELTVPCSYCGAGIDADTQAVVFTEMPEAETLAALLPHTKISEATLACEALPEQISALEKTCPDILWHWTLDLCGQTVTPETEELIYNGQKLGSTEPFYAALPLLRKLTKLEMCGCGIENKEMDELRTAFPEKGIVWTIKSKYWTVRTDIKYFATWNIVKYDKKGRIAEAHNIYNNTNKSLNWLRYCHDIVALDIGHNKVKNIEFVRNMPHLKYLIIADNEIKDLSPLEGLEELYFLEIFKNPITNLKPLSGLKSLKYLNMCNVKAKDLKPLDELELAQLFFTDSRLGTRAAWKARKHYLRLHPKCDVVIAYGGEYTGYGWRKTKAYRDMRHALNCPA